MLEPSQVGKHLLAIVKGFSLFLCDFVRLSRSFQHVAFSQYGPIAIKQIAAHIERFAVFLALSILPLDRKNLVAVVDLHVVFAAHVLNDIALDFVQLLFVWPEYHKVVHVPEIMSNAVLFCQPVIERREKEVNVPYACWRSWSQSQRAGPDHLIVLNIKICVFDFLVPPAYQDVLIDRRIAVVHVHL